MAERRMLKKSLLNRDDFTQMPNDAKLLYVLLVVNADDEGFVDNPNGIALINHIAPDCLKILVAKRFIIPFHNGNLIVIRDWRAQNRISERKRQETDYAAELQMLKEVKGKYYLIGAESIPDQLPLSEDAPEEDFTGELISGEEKNSGPVQYSTVQYSLVKGSCSSSTTTATTTTTTIKQDCYIPTLEEVKAYCLQRRAEGYLNYFDPEHFMDVNDMRDWKDKNGNPIRWKTLVKLWEQRGEEDKKKWEERRKIEIEMDTLQSYLALSNRFKADE